MDVEPTFTLLTELASQFSTWLTSSSMAFMSMIANPLVMLWWGVQLLILDGEQWPMGMESRSLVRVIYGSITIPSHTVLMAWLMLWWVQLLSQFPTITLLTIMRYVFCVGLVALIFFDLASSILETLTFLFSCNVKQVMLLGHSDSYVRDKTMQVTIAFNHFGTGLIQRMPRYCTAIHGCSQIMLWVHLTFRTIFAKPSES